jgi:hypothetical protein
LIVSRAMHLWFRVIANFPLGATWFNALQHFDCRTFRTRPVPTLVENSPGGQNHGDGSGHRGQQFDRHTKDFRRPVCSSARPTSLDACLVEQRSLQLEAHFRQGRTLALRVISALQDPGDLG